MVRHFTTLFDLTSNEARTLLASALALKSRAPFERSNIPLVGRTLGLLFEKPSLRTRVSFEAAIAQLGGSAVFLPAKEVGLGQRETVADFARVLSQYVDALAVRTFTQATVDELARHATIPVINALSDWDHPCQAMADLMTVHEVFGRVNGVRIAFVGDGNNVAQALAVASTLTGAHFVLCCPRGYEFSQDFQQRYADAFPRVSLELTHDAGVAVADADVIYTDVWTSMGQEDEAERRAVAFRPYQVNRELMNRAQKDAIFLHCLPAHRGQEVTDDVLDGPSSHVMAQAANRLHFQKALLLWLLDPAQLAAPIRPARSLNAPTRRRRKTG